MIDMCKLCGFKNCSNSATSRCAYHAKSSILSQQVIKYLEGGDCNLDAPEHHQSEEEEQHSQSCHDISNNCPYFAVPSSRISC